ncbi:nuclear envelope pore membrane protein POM 121, partial [Cololabis saira]|uniref:nuclear envelope pore membrane protein POM 121 n=1 Tax=Cololabis saira TaxID=129043 RepID=UPI002AD45FF3
WDTVVPRRRAVAMSPREKHLALLSVLALLTVAFYYIPSFLYATLILGFCGFACYYRSGEPLPARLGRNPRRFLSVPAALRRWLADFGASGLSVTARGKARFSSSSRRRADLQETEGHFRQRPGESGFYRREALARDSFMFSPRDFLMGSYIVKPDSPGRPRRNPREQLREKLSRPNYAVHTPNRRLSFHGETPGTPGRFTITPQRHYPLQQPGVSSVGVLPPTSWDGFRKKSILSPRNFPAALSPVTVKIARPDHSSPRMDHLSCAEVTRTPADPCSKESVLRVLKESRKRDVEDEDRSFTTEQKSKRRRNDSGGSAHSAFESLLPNGAPSQLIPKPGSLKRGMTSAAEDSIMKRSRTSSISSGTALHASRGSSGTRRNAIQSSYSSSMGLSQGRKTSAPSSALSSPGSSRSQTPEGVSKRPREEDTQSPSSASSVKSDHNTSDRIHTTSNLTPIPKVPVTTSTNSAGSGGKRKRKIQLVSSHRDDQITLPPPPELGYTVTAKDLDEEKKAAISKIQKVLETPAPEPEKAAAPPAATSTQPPSSTSSTTTTLSSLLAAPLSTMSSTNIPVINLDSSPAPKVSTAPAISNPLLEALKMKTITPASSISAASTITVSVSATPVPAGSLNLKGSSAAPQLAPTSQSSPGGVGGPSAFSQLLSQVSKAPTSAPAPVATLFGLSSQVSSPSSSLASPQVTATLTPVTAAAAAAPASSSGPVSNTNPLLASGFKPIFPATTTSSPATSSSEIKASIQNFKPIFGDATATAAAAFAQPTSLTTASTASTTPASSTPSMFGVSTSSTTAAPPPYPGFNTSGSLAAAAAGSITTAQPAATMAVKTLFGNWSKPSTTSSSAASVQPLNTGSTFSFGAATTGTTAAAPAAPAVATTASTQGAFTFGATQPNPQASTQKVFSFGQTAPTQNTTTASFGGFAMATTASTAAATSAPQSTFAFGKPAFDAAAAAAAPPSFAPPPSFGSTAAQPKPFTFGNSGSSAPASSNPAPAPAPAPFTFGAAATTTATTFGTPAKPTFGASSTGFAFGATQAPSAPPSFGAATQTQSSSSSTFTFGGAAPQPAPAGPAQPATGGFNFAPSMPCPQFGTPVSNPPAPQMGSFNFGAAATDKPAFGTSTPSFGQSAAAAPIPFGSPGTPVQGFNPPVQQFGTPATPSFSIGAGSRPSGARQRLQARRQHNRKK